MLIVVGAVSTSLSEISASMILQCSKWRWQKVSIIWIDCSYYLVLIITEKKLNELQANTNMLWFISFKNINESKTTKQNLALSPIVPIKCNWRYQIDVNYKMNRNVFIFVVKLFKSSPISGSYNHTSGNSSLFESDKVHKTIT